MDSKLKRQVIVSAVIISMLCISMAFVVNYIQTGSFFPDKNRNSGAMPVSKVAEATSASGDELQNTSLYTQYDLNPKRDPYAFLSDDSFFDKESKGNTQPVSENNVSLLVSSVEKDVRINIVDATGKLIKNESFFVSLLGASDQVENKEIYKDLDKDGVIYIGDIMPGDYLVSLEPMSGYEIASEPTKIKVKEKIEYRVIENSAYLLKTEADIDPSIEDTEQNGAPKDADDTEKKEKLSQKNALFGIDVSKWNKEIDWMKVKESGVEFAIIRCGYRGSSSGALVEDPYFKKNMEGATKAGIKVGVYFFTQATNPVEAVEEASVVMMLCQPYKLSLPMFIDTEGAGGNGRADQLDQETRTAVCDAFCETVKNAGYSSGIYASKSWLNNNLLMDKLEKQTVWLAQYSEKPTYDGEYQLWQYTSNGAIDGINGRVDLNLSYEDYQ